MSIKQNGGVFGRNPTFNDVTIEGQLTFEGNIDIDSDITWEDDKKALFGNNGELAIYHHNNGTSYIQETGSGDLSILGTNFRVMNAAGTENKIVATTDGAVTLYENNNPKLTTQSGGVDITGTATMDGLTVSDAEPTLRIFDADNTLNQEQTIAFGTEPGDRTHAEIAGINTNTGNAAGALSFKTNSGSSITERMRIDDAGNLLVGTTDSTLFNNTSGGGANILSDGLTIIARQTGTTSDTVFIINDTGAGGSLQEFRKDGTTVGSIGTVASIMYIGKSDTTIAFDEASDSVKPRGTAGAQRDGSINLGTAGNRWKDLYLSGGVYLGGTGTANKLDDYEEGTWTPQQGNFDTWTSPTFAAKYVKIGNLVTLFVEQTGGTVGSSALRYIDGLPFQPSSENGGGTVSNLNVDTLGTVLTKDTGSRIWFTSVIPNQTTLTFHATYSV